MEKTERNVIEPITNVNFKSTKLSLDSWIQKNKQKLLKIIINRGVLIVFIGFLLGRALILAEVTPFALPFFAAVYVIQKNRIWLAMLALLVGGISLSFQTSIFILASIVLFLFLNSITRRFSKDTLKVVPFLVFLSLCMSKLSILYFINNEIDLYNLMLVGVESGLGFILTLIFLQSVTLVAFRKRKQTLKTEEIISLIILLASIMTGLIGWSIYDLSIEYIASRYFVLLLACAAGATIGTTVGVVTGLILSLANIGSLFQMSLLAFSGLLGGLLKDGRKIGVSVGLLIGTLLLGMYNDANQLQLSVIESLLAIFIFLLTPQSFISQIAKYIPGTIENMSEQQQYLQKVRDVTASRVSQFSSVFQALSSSFENYNQSANHMDEDVEIDYVLSNVTMRTCQLCYKKDQCWTNNLNKTYDYMKNIMHEYEQSTLEENYHLQREWNKHCIKPDKVINVIKDELTLHYANQKLKEQIRESRKLVAEQLLGVSQVMGDFANEIKRERDNHHVQEEQILDAVQGFGVEIGHVEIYCLEQGNIDIEMSIPFCNGRGESEKLIAPMLSDILQETIIVTKEECAAYPNGYCQATFGSAKTYKVDTGVAHAAKGGGLISGDSYSTIELGAGKYAIAISDGMGNGQRAHHESNETLELLQKILKSGIEEKVAIKSVNSVLSLRTTDEIFSTLDLVMIDLQDASAKFLKIGSSPSFIKRGEKVISICASNLPMGIIQDFEVDVVSEQLKAGDLLIMMSDGIFEGPKHVENYDIWMKRKIKDLQTKDPQHVADLIMEEVIRTRSGNIDDDMTIVVAKVDHNTPKWAAIPAHMYEKKAQ
ncbi:stage II sporulation protein E [Cytobacillus sp. Hm23]